MSGLDREADKFERHPWWWSFSRVTLTVLFIVALGGLIGGGTLVWNFFTASATGKANVHIQNESADNRIQAQSLLLNEYNDVKATQHKIDATLIAVKHATDQNPKDFLGTTLLGQINYCETAVAQYNADTHKLLVKDWKPASLPSHIDSGAYCVQ